MNRHPEEFFDQFGSDSDFPVFPGAYQFGHHLAADFANFSFQVSHPGFTGISDDDFLKCIFLETNPVFLETVIFSLPWNQEAVCDFLLFQFGVSRKRNLFHTVKQGAGNALGGIGSTDKQHT